jgi:hypothetical protein
LRKTYLLFIVLVLVLTLVVGCGTTTTEKPKTEKPTAKQSEPTKPDDTYVELELTSASRQGSDILFEGTTNLPDGALIAYEVTNDNATYFVDGNATVAGGKFQGTAAAAPEGPIEVWVAFQTIVAGATQPAEIIDTYGELGENITGDVTKTGDMTRVEKTMVVD